MANIREHCSWVHSKEKEAATKKAKDIIRMSVARTHLLEALQEFDLPVDKRALVVGGGVAGMTAALSIAEQGHQVYLVEKEKSLGGLARRLHNTLEGLDVQAYLADLVGRVYRHPLVHVYTGATIEDAVGYVGNFLTRVRSDRGLTEIKHGATVLAVGAQVYEPTEYLYGEDRRVVTHLELEELISKEDERVTESKTAGHDPVRGLPQRGSELLQPHLLQRVGQERPETQGDKPGDGRLHPLPGHADLRHPGELLPGSLQQRRQVSSATPRRTNPWWRPWRPRDGRCCGSWWTIRSWAGPWPWTRTW